MAAGKAGIALIIVGSIFLIAGIVIGIVFQVYVREHAFDNYLVYKRDSNFNDPNYVSCTNESFNAFMFNLTNANEVLAGTAKPNYEQKGPYNYTRAVCTFNVTNDNNYQYSKMYWEPYYLLPGNGVSDSDLFTNFNPGYLGVIKTVEAVSPVDPETALLSNFLGPALQEIIGGLTSPAFLNQAKGLGVALVLSGIRTEVLPEVQTQLKAIYALQVVYQELFFENITSEDYFNVVGTPNGIATYFGFNQSFSAETQRRVLFGNISIGEGYGWFSDTKATGLLYFLQKGGTALLNNDANTLALLESQYELTALQLTILLEYSSGQLLTKTYKAAISDSAINATALNLFYSQWANCTGIDPSGLDLNQNGNHTDDGFELNGLNPSNISLTTVTQLWDENNQNSLLSLHGIAGWYNALNASLYGNQTLIQALAFTFELTLTQITLIGNYLQVWQSVRVEPILLAQYNVTSLVDIAYIQYGSGILNGLSVADFENLPAAPEFGIFASRSGLPPINPTRIRNLVQGFLGTNGSAPTFLGLYNAGQFAFIQQAYGLNQTEAGEWAAYLLYIMKYFVDPIFTEQIFPAGGGPITTRTARQILWEAVDPLLTYLEGVNKSQVGVFYDIYTTPYSTKDLAINVEPLQNVTIYMGGSLTDLQNFLQIKVYKGLPYVPGYHNVTVSGNKDGKNFVPNSLQSDKVEPVWFSLIAQPITFSYNEDITLKGIDIQKYGVTDDFFLPESQNPDKIPYDQVYAGLINVTGIKGLRTFLSLPHFKRVDPIVANSVTGLDPNDPYYDDNFIGINYLSGITMQQSVKAQVTVGYPALTRFYNISAGYAPLMWQDMIDVISDDDATTFKNALNTLQIAVIVPFVLGGGIGLILIAIGVVFLFVWRKRRNSSGEERVKPKDDVPMDNLEINDDGVETRNSISDSD